MNPPRYKVETWDILGEEWSLCGCEGRLEFSLSEAGQVVNTFIENDKKWFCDNKYRILLIQ